MTPALEKTGAETFVLNLGPQHPATHGVLRVKLVMDGEYIESSEPVIGYIHRMHEKMGENRTLAQFLPNTSRMDYLGAMAFTQCYVMAVERAAGIKVPERAEYIRVICTELNRIQSHLVWFGAYILDLGGFTPFLYVFDDRDRILDMLERVTGSRLTYCYYRFGGVCNDVDDEFLASAKAFCSYMRSRMKMYHDLVTTNIILMKRLDGIGIITPDMCRRYGASGPVARGSGLAYDVRKSEPYSVYPRFNFNVPTYHECDSMARYKVRIDEIVESTRIIEQAVDSIPAGPFMDEKVPRTLKPAKGDFYQAVEAPRGSFGVRLVSDGTNQAYRLKLRSPCFSNLNLLDETARGTVLADYLAIMGSLDLVIPEIDR